jgi:hypothetical protein
MVGLKTLLASLVSLGGPQGCTSLELVPFIEQVDYRTEIQPIFEARCTGCHVAGSSLLDLTAGASLAQLLERPSVADPTQIRVRAGRPAESLLWRKLLCSDPGLGAPMPPGLPLSLFQRALINDWIVAGANGPHPERVFGNAFESR